MKKVAMLGPGTFSEASSLHYLNKEDFEFVPCKLISEVFGSTAAGVTDLSVIPIENTLEGSVTLHVDLLVHEVDLPIRAEWILPIDMNLIGYRLTEPASKPDQPFAHIRRILSHQAVPAQCSKFMKQYLSGAEFEQVSSTAEGARIVSELKDPAVAAIGPTAAATLYGADILAPEIQDHKGNMTRFLLVGKESPELPSSEHIKTTILVTLPEDYPGALHQVLSAFAWRRINLSKIESRPTKKKLGTYFFYIDIEGAMDSVLLPAAIQEIEAIGCQVRILGCYPSYSYES
jgi:prephenate dehydratase